MRRLRTTGGALLLGGILLAACVLPSSAAASKTSRIFWGVHPLLEQPRAPDFQKMAQAGVGIARIQASWRNVEPHAPSGLLTQQRSYRWKELDAVVGGAAQRDVSVMLLLETVPRWVNSDYFTSPMTSKEGREGWRDFVAAVVGRYGTGGDFWLQNPTIPYLPVFRYQIWNEQNSGYWYRPRPNPKQYAGLLRISAEQIRKDPHAQVILGGMFGTPRSDHSMPAWRFLRKLYRVNNAARDLDGVAVHPHGRNVREIAYQLNKMRRTIVASGQRKTPIHVTEIGWGSSAGPSIFHKGTVRGQRRMLVRSFKYLLSEKRRLKLRSIYWHGWRDTSEPIDICGACSSMGLLRRNRDPKPAFRAYRRLARS